MVCPLCSTKQQVLLECCYLSNEATEIIQANYDNALVRIDFYEWTLHYKGAFPSKKTFLRASS